jgi:hypothetical protein
LAQGACEVLPVVDKRCDGPDADQPLESEPAAKPCQDDDKEVSQNARQRHEQEGEAVGPHCGTIDVLIAPPEGRERRFRAPERLDRLLSADGLLHDAVELAEAPLQFAETLARVPRDKPGERKHDGNHQKGGQRQTDVQYEHRDEDTDQREDPGKKRGDILRNRLVDCLDIAGEAAHQLARRVAVEKADRQGLHVGEEVSAKPFQCPL